MKHTILGPVCAAVFSLFAISSGSAWPASQAEQSVAPPASIPTGAPSQRVEEISSRDVSATFRSNVNLVMVPVVVRDAKGNATGNLRREDFRLLDNGKPQVIKHFSIETAATRASAPQTDMSNPAETKTAEAAVVPRRFIAYVFDDLHMGQAEFIGARNAADKQLSAAQPGSEWRCIRPRGALCWNSRRTWPVSELP